MKIKEVIVVEGRDDTARLREALGPDIDTIETNGSAINQKTLAQIKLAQARRGVIVLTDPDFSGKRIRNIITQHVSGVKHAFLTRQEALPHKQGSLGVEHADPATLRRVLQHVYTPLLTDDKPVISRDLLMAKGLIVGPQARARREKLGDLLHIGYANGKQLLRRLHQFAITPAALQAAVEKIDSEEK